MDGTATISQRQGSRPLKAGAAVDVGVEKKRSLGSKFCIEGTDG